MINAEKSIFECLDFKIFRVGDIPQTPLAVLAFKDHRLCLVCAKSLAMTLTLAVHM